MVEGKGTSAPKQEKESSKRPPWWERLWGWTEFGKKSGWQWLELLGALAVPVVLTIAGLWFTAYQGEREAERAELERELEEQRAQDEALQAYLDQMSMLLLEKDLSDNKVRTLLRARTITVLGRLDPSRKKEIIQFLVEAELIQSRDVDESVPIISLVDADLREADLSDANLNLKNADLSDANLREAELNLALLVSADLSGADLREANLSGAQLQGAALNYARLRDADPSDADLSDADLSGARGVIDELLAAQAGSLEGATMPNGQKYEDWLKSRGEDAENK